MDKLKKALLKLVEERYGIDEFSKFLIYIFLLICIANTFIKSMVIYTISFLISLFIFFRFFSKNKTKRTAENARFLEIKKKFITDIENFINKVLGK